MAKSWTYQGLRCCTILSNNLLTSAVLKPQIRSVCSERCLGEWHTVAYCLVCPTIQTYRWGLCTPTNKRLYIVWLLTSWNMINTMHVHVLIVTFVPKYCDLFKIQKLYPSSLEANKLTRNLNDHGSSWVLLLKYWQTSNCAERFNEQFVNYKKRSHTMPAPKNLTQRDMSPPVFRSK